MSLVLGTCVALLGLFAFLHIFWPLFSQTEEETGFSPQLRKLLILYQEKHRLLLNLEDLDIDSKEGKISDIDSQSLRSKLMGQIGIIYNQIEELEKKDEFLVTINKQIGGS